MPLRVAMLANWGLGRELAAALGRHPEVEIVLAVTRLAPLAGDPWSDCVARFCRQIGLIPLDDAATPVARIGELLRECRADIMWTHAYMRRLPREVFAVPRLGTVNVHPSLLPRHRGPAPSHWVLANHEPETGLTAHVMDEGLDTGPIVHQERLAVRGNESLGNLVDGLKPLMRPLVSATIDKLLSPGFVPRIQDEGLASYAPRPQEVRS